MISHPDPGTLQARLDRELAPDAHASATRHVEECAECRATEERLRALAHAVTATLPPVELSGRSLGRARWAVRSRRRHRARGERRGRVAVAASVLLLVGAGAASALPASPLRGWWEGLRRQERVAPVPAVQVEDPIPVTAQPGASGVGVPVVDGRVQILFEDVPAGTLLEVTLVVAERAFAEAPAGTEFSVEATAGRARALVGSRPGPIRVALPIEARDSEVLVNGTSLYPPSATAGPTGAPTGPAGPRSLSADGSQPFRILVPVGSPAPPTGTGSGGGG